MMRWLLSFLLLTLLGVASARSIAGPRLLVVLEDAAEKEQYGVFLGDLEGMPFFDLLEGDTILYYSPAQLTLQS
jgi:oligosaccharyltransferase complex subunit beta